MNGLELGDHPSKSCTMRQGPFARLRAFVLLVALGIGLAGQAAASSGMQMAQGDTPRLTAPMGGPGGCPGCDGNGSPQAPALSCGIGFCPVSPAILSQAVALKPAPQATFPPITAEKAEGITVRPDLGPPRPIPHA